MRNTDHDEAVPSGRIRRGRAVIVGYGLDDSGGHVRITCGDAFRLYGGSDAAHGEMLRAVERIREEAEGQGISFDSMTRDEYRLVQDLAERAGGP